MIPFSSERKAMGVVIKLPSGQYRFYAKGASEILSKRCDSHVVVRKGDGAVEGPVEIVPIDDLARENISRTIIFYANQTLRTIALCYRDFPSWPPTDMELNEEREVSELLVSPFLFLITLPFTDRLRRLGSGNDSHRYHRY
jgi:Ca2+-transporting ATPase